jgi:hypothetical protein
MSLSQILIVAVHLFFALAGLGLILLGAWGSLPTRRHRAGTPLAAKQRVLVTIMGLFCLAAAWNYLSGWLPLGR